VGTWGHLFSSIGYVGLIGTSFLLLYLLATKGKGEAKGGASIKVVNPLA